MKLPDLINVFATVFAAVILAALILAFGLCKEGIKPQTATPPKTVITHIHIVEVSELSKLPPESDLANMIDELNRGE